MEGWLLNNHQTTFHAHRAVVCTQSKFFEAACKQGFKVSSCGYTSIGNLANHGLLQEGSTGIVQLEEEDENHVRAMIEYLYTFQYREAEGDDLEICISHGPTEEHTYGMSFPGSLSLSFALRYYKETVRGNFTKQSCWIPQ